MSQVEEEKALEASVSCHAAHECVQNQFSLADSSGLVSGKLRWELNK